MNLQAAIDIFVNERLRFGVDRHIAARDAIRAATRARNQATRDLMDRLWQQIRAKYC